jgi:hippurate hydrolase
MHVAALLGAARLLADRRDRWSGTFLALFQPAEENAAGATAMIADGLVVKLPTPDVALSQHVMPYAAGRIGTTTGPVLSAGDSVKITLYGAGAHGSMPHKSVDPVVLAASVVLRLQSIVSREVPPGQSALVTVGASHAGSKSNIIPDRATLLLNLRTYDMALRDRVIAAIERIVRGECQAAGSPRAPEFHYYDQFPLTDNHQDVTDVVFDQAPLTASEDFSRLPDAFGGPYTYWTVGSVDPQRYRKAVEDGTVDTDIPANHSPFFYPEIDPTLSLGTQAHVVAALSYLSKEK